MSVVRRDCGVCSEEVERWVMIRELPGALGRERRDIVDVEGERMVAITVVLRRVRRRVVRESPTPAVL